jgi:hypothetical protein
VITVFRRLRKKLVEKGGIWRYTLYAIGEILLVVVGILIALQVNNWNEDRKERDLELKMLSQIEADLKGSSENISELYMRLEISVNSADSLLKSFRNQTKTQGFVFHASLIHRRFFFNPSTSGYAQLRTSSANVIQNDVLRNRIVEIYEGEFEEIKKRQELLSEHMTINLFPLSRSRFNLNKQISFRMSNFDDNSLDFYEPNDFETLAKDTEFANAIVVQKRLYTIQLNQLEITRNVISKTLDMLENDIQRLVD